MSESTNNRDTDDTFQRRALPLLDTARRQTAPRNSAFPFCEIDIRPNANSRFKDYLISHLATTTYSDGRSANNRRSSLQSIFIANVVHRCQIVDVTLLGRSSLGVLWGLYWSFAHSNYPAWHLCVSCQNLIMCKIALKRRHFRPCPTFTNFFENQKT